ncbi:uncharacterized protein [Venturia canescens]|uniref:uncharacterized protein n=1 Tax=Venturia canescens TaxID=32260 RepID=UPI001C9D36DD|nr:uncharacterized protein LOC122416582 [Venturia canescens]
MALTTDTANQKKFNLREKDFPKLDSIQLDHLLKKTLMENKRKKKYDSNNPKPNLTKARKRGATDVASEDTADKSNNASSPSEEWELPKRPIKRRTTTSTQDNGDINLTENQYQQLSDDSEYEEDENNTDMEVNQAQVNQLKKVDNNDKILTSSEEVASSKNGTESKKSESLKTQLNDPQRLPPVRQTIAGNKEVDNEKNELFKAKLRGINITGVLKREKTKKKRRLNPTPNIIARKTRKLSLSQSNRLQSFLLKGINSGLSEIEVEAELKELTIPGLKFHRVQPNKGSNSTSKRVPNCEVTISEPIRKPEYQFRKRGQRNETRTPGTTHQRATNLHGTNDQTDFKEPSTPAGIHDSRSLHSGRSKKSATNAKRPQKVIGGTPAYPGEIPYQVSIRYQGNHVCGGAIISNRHVLTSAACAQKLSNIRNAVVVTGSTIVTKGEIHQIKQVLYHSNWNRYTSGAPNDLAIITLFNGMNFNYFQNKINLPYGPPPSRVTATVSGWGTRTNPSNYAGVGDLSKAQVYTIGASECHTILQNTSIIWTSQICTRGPRGVGICSGDEGGPLAYNGQLIGIISWGILCGQGYPDVYTSVYHYLPWINYYMRNT